MAKNGIPVVCPDEIRIALHGQRFVPDAEHFVWGTAKLMVKALFGAGHDTVIVDATNCSSRSRKEWVGGNWGIVYQFFQEDPEVCKQRAIDSGQPDLIPVIERMYPEFQEFLQVCRENPPESMGIRTPTEDAILSQ